MIKACPICGNKVNNLIALHLVNEHKELSLTLDKILPLFSLEELNQFRLDLHNLLDGKLTEYWYNS